MPSADAYRLVWGGMGEAPASATARRPSLADALTACVRQWRAERALERRGVHFRSTDPEVVASAYAAMDRSEFEAVNSRQEWANWRTIPAALEGRLPNRPIVAADLGCGTGASTVVLAHCCPAGSTILGYECAEPLVKHARRRRYVHANGQLAKATFVRQMVDEPFRWPGAQPIEEETFDLVNASGMIGHHFSEETVHPLLRELQRATASGGFALLDDGPALPASALERLMRGVGFQPLGRYRSWLFAPVGQTLFVKLSHGARSRI